MIETIHLQLLLATFAGWVGRELAAIQPLATTDIVTG